MPRNKTDSVRVNTYMPRRLLLVTQRFAELHGLSYSEVMRTALAEYIRREVDREKKNAPAGPDTNW